MFEPEGRARHFLEDVDPTFALNVRQGDLLVAAGGLMDFIRAHLKAEAARRLSWLQMSTVACVVRPF